MALSFAVLLVFQMYLEKQQKKVKPDNSQTEVAKKKEKKPAASEKVIPDKAVMTHRVVKSPVKRKTASGGRVPPRSITIDTPLYKAVMTTAGGGFTRFELKKYADQPGETEKGVNIIGADGEENVPYGIFTGETNPPIPPEIVFSTSAESVKVEGIEPQQVNLLWKSSHGLEIVRSYTFHADSYVVEIKTEYRNGTGTFAEITPGVELSQIYTEVLKGDKYSFKGLVANIGSDVKRFTVEKIAKGKGPKANANWVALDSKYFTLGCITSHSAKVAKSLPLGEKGIKALFLEDKKRLNVGDSYIFTIIAYLGPKDSNTLKNVGSGFESVLDYGFFGWIAKPLVLLLKYSNGVTGNYGIDIILLTIIIKILFYPLTRKSYVSMKKMQEIQPILKKVQDKHKGDKQRLNQEVMSLYKTYKINPLSGCMPMVLQIPVFFALYKALLVAIELRHAPFMWWINDLSAAEHLWDIHLAGYALPIRLLPLLMGVSMYVQQKMSPSSGVDPTQQKLMNLLPLIFTFMFWSFPSGLVLYWLVNNIITIGQQSFIMKGKDKEAVKA